MHPEPSFAPVMGPAGCAGHVLRTARGRRAFDRDDREIAGNFASADMAVKALLERAMAEAG